MKKKKKSKAVRKRREAVPLPDGISLNDLVWYYDCGWRVGRLKEVRSAGTEVGISPVAAYKKSAHNLTWHKVSDIKSAKGVNERRT